MSKTVILQAVGAIAAVAGLGLVIYQAINRPRSQPSRKMEVKAGPLSASFSTTYVGLLVLALGIAALICAALIG